MPASGVVSLLLVLPSLGVFLLLGVDEGTLGLIPVIASPATLDAAVGDGDVRDRDGFAFEESEHWGTPK